MPAFHMAKAPVMTPAHTPISHGRLLLGTLWHNFWYGRFGDSREAVEEAHA